MDSTTIICNCKKVTYGAIENVIRESNLLSDVLKAFDEEKVVIQPEGGEEISFQRKAVAIVKPVIQFEDEDLPEIGEITEDEFSEMELE